MKISTKGRYALRMMIDLAERDGEGWIALKDISSRQNVSTKYLEQIISGLNRAGFLHSCRGPHGGYMLARPAREITTGEILRCIEGPIAPVACLQTAKNECERREICPSLHFWENLNVLINDYFDSVTLGDLVITTSPINCMEIPEGRKRAERKSG